MLKLNFKPSKPALFQIQSYCGTEHGWLPVSPAVLTRDDANRRIRLYRGVRGAWRTYRIVEV